MAKEVDLLSYWMPFLRQLREFKEIAKAEEPELRLILEASDRTLANMFIETADEYGISCFERMMGIYPIEGETLDVRRLNVQINWNNRACYTNNELHNLLTFLCGSADKFSVTNYYADYLIEVVTKLGGRGAFDTVVKYLQDILPCNLVLQTSNVLEESSKTTSVNIVGVTSVAMSYLITNDLKETVSTSDKLTVASPVSTASVLTIT